MFFKNIKKISEYDCNGLFLVCNEITYFSVYAKLLSCYYCTRIDVILVGNPSAPLSVSVHSLLVGGLF